MKDELELQKKILERLELINSNLEKIFILDAIKAGLARHDIRKTLNVAMSKVTAVSSLMDKDTRRNDEKGPHNLGSEDSGKVKK